MPRLPQTEQERARIRARILDAARALFDEEGIGAVSMRAVGRRVGLTASALYAYFPSKTELVRDLWSDAKDDLARRLQAISAAHDDPLAAIRALACAYAEYGLEDPVRFRVLFLSDEETRQDEFFARTENYSPYFLVRHRVEEAIGRGLVRISGGADLVAQTLWAAVHGVVVLIHTCVDFPFHPPRLLVATTIDAVIDGVTRPTREGEGR